MSDFNLGTVTAYGYAKDKGYTGTEDEYAALMASYADVAEQAAESATQAAASATTASTKASEAAASATAAASSKTAAETAQGGAETAAQTATTKAGEASTSATTASGKATEATTAAGTATTKASEATTAATTATTKAGEASTSATNAAASATRAQEILDSIPADYSQLSDDVDDLKDGLSETDSVLTLDDQTPIPFTEENDGYYIRFSNGELISSSTYCTTNYINVTMYKSLLYKRVCVTSSSATTVGMSFYDANKVYVSGERARYSQPAVEYQDSQISIPDNAVYARFSIFKNETYGEFAVSGSSIIRNTLDAYKGEIDENSAILAFDDSISLDAPITDVGKFVKYSTGELSSASVYSATGYVDVSKYAYLYYKRLSNTEASPTNGMAFYDANKVYISGERGLSSQSSVGYVEGLRQIEVPSNAVYARFTTRKDTETYGEFEVNGRSKVFDGIKPYYSPFEKDVIFGSYSSDWYEGQGESYSGFGGSTLYTEVITAWDALVTNGKGYITKEEIGKASDDQTMYVYKLIPTRYRNNTGTSVTNNPPTFLIVPSLHGYEKSAVYGTYYFARDLVYNYDKNPVLNSIRTKCAIYVVPVGNPSGFDANTRKNSNGVDLNRNWAETSTYIDDPTSPYYPGAEPLNQPETQAIKSVIDASDNLLFVVDYHTDGQYKAASWANVNWMDCPHAVVEDEYFKRAYIAGQMHISEITENLSIEYNLDTNGETIGSLTIGTEGTKMPTIGYYARTQNVMGFTFEGNNGLPSEESSYSATEQKINSELIGNWIKNLLLVYKDASLK